MTWLAFCVYFGGLGVAYRRGRRHFGRLRAALASVFWPCGVGYRLARDFYVNEDWPGEKRHARPQR